MPLHGPVGGCYGFVGQRPRKEATLVFDPSDQFEKEMRCFMRVYTYAAVFLLTVTVSHAEVSHSAADGVGERIRAKLFDPVKALEGTWTTSDGTKTVFHVTSYGTVVRETMYPGKSNEMTNMYTLDGKSLLMTHYCAMGNQPRMKADALTNNRLVFKPAGVTDFDAGEAYMSAMTLVFVNKDHIEQRWTAIAPDGNKSEIVFSFKRTLKP